MTAEDDDAVVRFPVRRVYPKMVSGAEMLAQPEPPDEMVWAVCPRIHGRNLERCYHCPKWEHHEHHGRVQRGCYGLAAETCRTVFAMQARER